MVIVLRIFLVLSICFFTLTGRSLTMVMQSGARDTTIAPVRSTSANFTENTGREGKMSTLAVVGFVLAILVPPVGIVVSAIALHQVRKNHLRGRDLALAGIIVGASIIGVYLIALAVYGLLWLMFFQFL